MSSSSSDLDERFDAAASKARVTHNVSMANKGKSYGLYKQATEGPVQGERPGFFSQVARQKYDAWAEYGTMPKDEAKEKYISLVDTL